jgi:glutathione S-transferase
MTERLVLHEYSASGNCYKVRLTAALAGKPLDRREYDIMKGETRTRAFLADVSANGRIPVLQVSDRFIPESNAASYYVAEGSALIPSDPFDHADMLRWMFWEQYNHEPNIATLRFWLRWVGPDKLNALQKMQVPVKRESGEAALKLMDGHLAGRDWFVGRVASLADICLFAYTHVAGDADFDLARHPNVTAWIKRVEALPGYLPMNV